jgi:PadR family transcriptional regulator PadR
MRRTKTLLAVARALMLAPDQRHWGTDLSHQTGIPSGVLYPLLRRLLEYGWLQDEWEDPRLVLGRPPRRYYTVTEAGRSELLSLVGPIR